MPETVIVDSKVSALDPCENRHRRVSSLNVNEKRSATFSIRFRHLASSSLGETEHAKTSSCRRSGKSAIAYSVGLFSLPSLFGLGMLYDVSTGTEPLDTASLMTVNGKKVKLKERMWLPSCADELNDLAHNLHFAEPLTFLARCYASVDTFICEKTASWLTGSSLVRSCTMISRPFEIWHPSECSKIIVNRARQRDQIMCHSTQNSDDTVAKCSFCNISCRLHRRTE